ncbi:MAG: MarR family transcriptional regulator [Sporichthyaceae bacterium]
MAVDKTGASDTARALNSGAIHLLRGMRRVDRLSGLTPARLSALSVLVFGGPCTLGRLAKTEDVAGPTMTRIVDGLEAQGLARRTAHPDSARSVLISATNAGTDLMQAAARQRVDAIVAGLAAMSTRDQQRLRSAAPALVELAAVLREQHEPGAVAEVAES